MGTGVAILTPQQAADWIGVSLDVLERAPVRRCQLGPRIVRYLSSTLEADVANGALNFLRSAALDNTPKAYRRPRPKRWSETVYVVRARPSGKIKIGRAVDVEKRLIALQCGTWEFLEVVLTIPNDRSLERELHRRFRNDRLSGEWFEPSPAIMEWLVGKGAEL